MEELFAILFGRFVARFIGGNLRFVILRLFKSDLEYSRIMNKGKEFSFSDDFNNLIVGVVAIVVILSLFGLML